MTRDLNNDLYYRVSGNGYPVVFLHGFLESSSMWKNITLKESKAIYIDLPGHGKSVSIDADESISGMALKVNKILKHINLDSFILVGHSMGGYVGLELMRINQSCDHLILLNSNCWADSDLKRSDRDRISSIVKRKKDHFIYEAIPNLFHNPANYDSEVKALIKESLQMTSESISICSQAMKNRTENCYLLKNNPNSITVVQGLNDPIVDLAKMKSITDFAKVEMKVVDAGHMAHIEAKEDIIEILNKKITETN